MSTPIFSKRELWLGRLDALFAIGVWLLLFFLAPHDISSDGTYRRDALVKWMDHSQIADSKWPMIGTYLAGPLYALGRHYQTPLWWLARYNVLLLGVGVLALDRILLRVVPLRVVRAFGLLVLTTAMLPHETTDFGAEMFNALGVAVGLAAWGTGRFVWGTVLLALGVANMPASIVGLGFALTRKFFSDRRLRVVIPIAFAIGLVLLENTIRKGGPFKTGYDHEAGYKTFLPYSGLPDFSYPLPLGVLSLIFSFGKGILFFSPGIFLPWRKERHSLDRRAQIISEMWVLYVVGLFAVYARWWAWYGGYTWGPRFFVFASIPAAFVLATKIRQPANPTSSFGDALLILVLAVSLWVGVDGITFRMVGQPFCMGNQYANESYCWYIPEFSVLTRPFIEHSNTNSDMRLLLGVTFAVFIYLGAPLLWRLMIRGVDAGTRALTVLDPRRWRF